MIIDAQFLHTLDRFHVHTQISHQSGPNKLSFGEQKRPYTKCWETTVQQRGTPRIVGSLMLYVPEPSMTKKNLHPRAWEIDQNRIVLLTYNLRRNHTF